MNTDFNINKELVNLYENSIKSNKLPDKESTEKIIEIRSTLSQPFLPDNLNRAKYNTSKSITDKYIILYLGILG